MHDAFNPLMEDHGINAMNNNAIKTLTGGKAL